MKKIVIAGSAKLQKEIKTWVNYFESLNYTVLDYPKEIEKETLLKNYQSRYKEFFKNITNANILFIMNEDKNNIEGYIGAETFAELSFALAQKLIYEMDIELFIYKMPSKKVSCYDEINLYLNLGLLKLFKKQ